MYRLILDVDSEWPSHHTPQNLREFRIGGETISLPASQIVDFYQIQEKQLPVGTVIMTDGSVYRHENEYWIGLGTSRRFSWAYFNGRNIQVLHNPEWVTS